MLLQTLAQVDENLDGCVDWEEFRLMFNRNVNDKTGLEPSKLYNMVSCSSSRSSAHVLLSNMVAALCMLTLGAVYSDVLYGRI